MTIQLTERQLAQPRYLAFRIDPLMRSQVTVITEERRGMSRWNGEIDGHAVRVSRYDNYSRTGREWGWTDSARQ